MIWKAKYYPQAIEDIKRLDGSQKKLVMNAIEKIKKNPLSIFEGGYGKPLGNKAGLDLSKCYKVKLKQNGIRIIYYLIKQETTIQIVIIGFRDDMQVYKQAAKRVKENNL